MSLGAGAYGPYAHHRGGFRVVWRLDAGGKQTTRVFALKAAAVKYRDDMALQIRSHRRTVETAIEEYTTAKARAGTQLGTSSKQVSQRLARIMADVLTEPLAKLTYTRCAKLYASLVAECEGCAKCGETTLDDAARPSGIRTCPKCGGGPAGQARTHHEILRTARTWARWCAQPPRRWFATSGSPWEHVEQVGRARDTRVKADGHTAGYTYDELQTYLRTARDLADAAIASGEDPTPYIAAMAPGVFGPRPGEVVQLQRRSLDEGGTVLRIDGWLKTANSHRDNVAGQATDAAYADILLALVKHASKDLASDDYVFHQTANLKRHRDPKWITGWVARVAAAAGLHTITPVLLRHTYFSVVVGRGGSVGDAARGAGNTTEVGLRNYTGPAVVRGAEQEHAARRLRVVP